MPNRRVEQVQPAPLQLRNCTQSLICFPTAYEKGFSRGNKLTYAAGVALRVIVSRPPSSGNLVGGITSCCKFGILASTSMRCAWKLRPSELWRSILVYQLEVKMLPLGRHQTAGSALEEFWNASKPAVQCAALQQGTIWQTYFAGCDADECLLAPLNTTYNCAINYSSQGAVSVRVCCFSNVLSIGARIPRSMHSTCQKTSCAGKKRLWKC